MKIITPLVNTILQRRKMLLEIERFLSLNGEFLIGLDVDLSLAHHFELTLDALILHSTVSPYQLKQAIETELICTFTRAYDNGVYQWDTVPPGYNFLLRIQANEHVDLTGTIPQ